jgi:ligand-binding sensor domain-containing protein
MAPLNTMRFQRFTDSIYVGTTKGLMFAFNYDVLDTITPNNTTNMPSPNVLEIEFDHFDSLWAVFGDVNDVPFAIAKLEGSTWTNVFDASNSPIDFSNFLGLEIDTLGNLWVADNMALHTLLTPNSPSWLGLNDNELVQNLNVYPNPATDQLTISSSTVNKNNYILFDPQGRKVLEGSLTGTTTQLDLSKLARGNYLLQIGEKKTSVKLVKE